VRSTPRLPKRRSPAPPRDRHLTAVLVGPRAPLDLATLAPFWRLTATLAPCMARVLLLDRGGSSTGRGELLPGVECQLADPSRPIDELLTAALAGVPEDERRVVAVATDRLASWSGDEIESADAYAAGVVARFAATAGRLVEGSDRRVDPGVVLAAGERLADLRALVADGPEDDPEQAPFDLRALARLRDLGVPPGEVSADLVTGLGGVRRLLERSGFRRGPRLAVDRLELPGKVDQATPARVVVEGWIVELPPVRRLVLAIGARRYPFAVEVDREDVAGQVPYLPEVRCGFRIAGRFGPLPPGVHEVALDRIDGRRLRRLGTIEIVPTPAVEVAAPAAAPALRVSRCEARLVDGELRLELAGEIESDERVDSLRVEIDGRRAFDVDRRRLALETGTTRGAPVPWTADERVDLPEGDYRLIVTARRERRTVASSAELRFTTPVVTPGPTRVICAELARLRRDSPAPVWGAVRLEGRLEPVLEGARVEVRASEGRAAASAVREDGRFAVRLPIPPPGEAIVEVVATREAETLWSSGPFVIRARPSSAPGDWPPALADILAALPAGGERFATFTPQELAARLAEVADGAVGQVDHAVRELAHRVRRGRRAPGQIRRELPPRPRDPLRVLFGSWEIPCSGHGGGAHLRDLLRGLGARHEITLIHPVYPGAEGLSEEVRSFVRELLAVPRGWQPPPPLAPFDVPSRMLWTASEPLRGAVANEALSGRFDLVNLEGSEMALHLAGGAIPSCLTPLELGSLARLAELPTESMDLDAAAIRLLDLIAALHFDCRRIADRVSSVITLTEPEALLLLPFLPERELFLNPIAVDLEAWSGGAAAREPASFLFVGTFRHPPNRAAAEELIEVVAPRLRARLPGAVLRIAGADPPPALVDRAAAAGVELLGWVDDLPALLGRSTAFLAPLRHGAGMRVKLLEAMAAGCPVVSTSLGMSGIAAPAGEAYLRAESAEEFVEAATALAAAPERGAALAAAARAVIERDHGIAVQAERRERIWAAMLEGEREG
jgi:glycosyltransferase involved in cell wall biosynthesis